jgi:hypothetical protein
VRWATGVASAAVTVAVTVAVAVAVGLGCSGYFFHRWAADGVGVRPAAGEACATAGDAPATSATVNVNASAGVRRGMA